MLASISSQLTSQVASHGIYAVFVLMAIDAVFPAASELVMLYAGAVAAGAFSTVGHVSLFGARLGFGWPAYLAMALSGTLGYLAGSIAGWGIGSYGGRPLLVRRGRWLHLTPENLDRAERWFERWGDWAVCLGRVTPVVRSFVSIPAGLARMPLPRFTVLTALGCVPWCFGIAGAGWALGSRYERFHHDFRYVDITVVALVVVAVVWYVRRRRTTRLARRGSDPAR